MGNFDYGLNRERKKADIVKKVASTNVVKIAIVAIVTGFVEGFKKWKE